MNDERKCELIRLLRPLVDKLREDKTKVDGKLNNGVLDNLFASLKDEIGSDFDDDVVSFRVFVNTYIPPANVTFKDVPRDDVISMAKECAHFDSRGFLTIPSRAKILKHLQGHEAFSEEGGGGELKCFLSHFCFLEMFEMKKSQREDEEIFYVATDQGEDFSVHEPSAKAALKKEEDDRDNSGLTRRGKKRTNLVYGARERIQEASKAHGRCDGFPDVDAVKHWIKLQKKKKTADNAGGAGAGASAGAGAGGSN